ncbi:(Fe-S)-binding protein [Methanomethylovorans hollandica]|nr:(Fe-S)-binding protein [Methanomethylovorans hollandica]
MRTGTRTSGSRADLMDELQGLADQCIDCKKCWDVCPVNMVTAGDIYTPQGKIGSLSKILAGEELTENEFNNIYLSTRCGACDDVCPVDIPITQIIQYERKLLAEQGREPAKTTLISKNILEKNSPGGKDPALRFSWVTPDLEIAESSDVAYMAGCWVAYSHPEIAQSTIRLLNKAGIKPMILKEEKCCGIFLIDSGHLDEIAAHGERYMEYIESLGVKKLLVSCPGCYHSIRDSYAELCRAPKFEVELTINVFKELLDEGKLKPKELNRIVAIRDACPIRHLAGVPRYILRTIGVEVIELFDGKTRCCGGPGGLKPNFPQISGDIAMMAVNRYKEVSDTLVSYCPFCMHHTEGVCKERNAELNMKDISVLLAESVLGE